MKVRLYLKDPDGVHDSIQDAVMDEVRKQHPNFSDLDLDDQDDLKENMEDRIKSALDPYIEYMEYIDLTIDTETGEAKLAKKV